MSGAAYQKRAIGGRAAAIFIDEGLSSLQNFLILFSGLHYLSVSGIGSFTLAYTAALIVESTLKSLLLEPLSIRFSASDAEVSRTAGGESLGASLVFGIVAFLGAAALSLTLRGDARPILLATGLMVPVIIVQEGWRVYFFAIARPWRAVANDAACLVGTLILVIVFVVRAREATPTILLILWAAGTGIGAVMGAVQTRMLPNVARSWRWTRTHWGLGSRLAGGSGIEQIAGRISLTLVSVIAGTVALGQFAASRTLLTPATTVVASALTFAIPEAVRLRKRGGHVTMFIGGVSMFFALVVLCCGAALAVAPAGLGQVIAGKNWEASKVLLLPVIVASAALAARQGPRVGLRVFERSSSILRLSCLTAVVMMAFTAAGAAAGGASGAAWMFALANVLLTLAWWLTYGVTAISIARAATAAASDSRANSISPLAPATWDR